MPSLLSRIVAITVPRKISAGFVGMLFTLGFFVLYVTGSPLLDVLELKTYDMRLRAAGPRPTPAEVVIVAIDEKSLTQVGRWPWSRRTQGRLVESLHRLGTRVIAYDVFFSEAENQRLLEQIGQLEAEGGYTAQAGPYTSLRRAIATDEGFGRTIAASGKVVLPMLFLMSDDETRHLSDAEVARARKSIETHAIATIYDSGDGKLDFPMLEPKGLIANLPGLQSGARHTGHINFFPDPDGALRWAPLVMRHQGRFIPSADVQAVRAFLGTDLALHTSAYGITGLSFGKHFVPTDEYGRVLTRYFGPEKTIATVSAADVLNHRVERVQLKDKIAIIGSTAKGIGDIRVTPYGSDFPGVEMRASVMQNLIANDFVRRPGWMRIFDVAALLLLGILLSAVLPRLGVRNGAVLTAALLALYIGIAIHLFLSQQVWLNVVYPALLMFALFMQTTIFKYFVTETEKRQIKSAFQHYVPAKVVDEIALDINKLRLGGEKRELTVLFSDIRGFTSIAETLAPEELVKLLNTYLTHMTDKIFAHDGLLDKYVGDAIMAVYGAPIFRPDHAKLACATALDMMAALHELQQAWKRDGQPMMDIGVGINTGPMIVGNMGSQTRFDYTVIGDAVNLGSRIEGLNKIYGTHILISEFTYQQVKDDFTGLREVDVAPVRGRHGTVRLYELIPPSRYRHLDWLGDYQRAYTLFHAGETAKARAVFEKLAAEFDDSVSRYYVRSGNTPRRRANDRT